MTNEVQGEILFQGIDSGASQYVHSPWFHVRGDYATFGIEVLSMTGSTTISWGVDTRTLEDPTVANLLNDQNVTSAGRYVATPGTANIPAQQLVRYRLATGGSATTTKYAILRVLEPSFQLDGR
jgi:hypothetical protein